MLSLSTISLLKHFFVFLILFQSSLVELFHVGQLHLSNLFKIVFGLLMIYLILHEKFFILDF